MVGPLNLIHVNNAEQRCSKNLEVQTLNLHSNLTHKPPCRPTRFKKRFRPIRLTSTVWKQYIGKGARMNLEPNQRDVAPSISKRFKEKENRWEMNSR